MSSPQAFPEGLASFALTGELRLRRPSRVLTVRSRLVPPNPLQSSLRTTQARRPARHCCPSCISHPIEGTQDPSHSRHNASGNRGTPKKKRKKNLTRAKLTLPVILSLLTLWGYLKLAFKLSHSSILKIFCVGAHQSSGQNNSSPYSHFQLCCVPPVADVYGTIGFEQILTNMKMRWAILWWKINRFFLVISLVNGHNCRNESINESAFQSTDRPQWYAKYHNLWKLNIFYVVCCESCSISIISCTFCINRLSQVALLCRLNIDKQVQSTG